MTKQHTTLEDIQTIVSKFKRYSQNDFVFKEHYWTRIQERQILHEFVLKTFFEFDKIKLVEEDILKYGDTGYDFYYELNNVQTLIIGVIPAKKLFFTHAILRYRNWRSALKQSQTLVRLQK